MGKQKTIYLPSAELIPTFFLLPLPLPSSRVLFILPLSPNGIDSRRDDYDFIEKGVGVQHNSSDGLEALYHLTHFVLPRYWCVVCGFDGAFVC